ncbi:MAG TPA: serine protease [Vicinamibacterales bacterium]|nr:serine protease [Vicinamibacterales bacterium]
MNASSLPIGVTFNLKVRPDHFSAIDVLDLHFPVVAGRRVAEDRLAPTSLFIYGTAFPFPVWHGGIFATAAHVVKSASVAGEVVLGRLGHDIPGYGVERAEIFENFDFALLKCPGLEKFPPVNLEMQASLRLFDDVSAVGYPFSVDPEHLVATHRGFAGHIVACRQLYRLPGQPFGYELSFPTPPGMSGAPLMHRGRDGSTRCYGFVVEHATTEFAGVSISLGIAVSCWILWSIRSRFLRSDAFSAWFGVSAAPQPPPHAPKQLAPDMPTESDLEDWTDSET